MRRSLFPEVRTAADKRRPTTAGFKIKVHPPLTWKSRQSPRFYLQQWRSSTHSSVLITRAGEHLGSDAGAVALQPSLHPLHQAEHEEAEGVLRLEPRHASGPHSLAIFLRRIVCGT
jgi:hypothetical protein